jgi:hypothetical protein
MALQSLQRVVVAAACAASAALVHAQDIEWAVRAPKEERVVFQGAVSFDGAGSGAAGMLYPAPNLAGFLAAVITHGLLVESTKKGQKDKLQQEADKVLVPYQDVLNGYTATELMRRSVDKATTGRGKRLLDASQSGDTGWLVESTPAFSLTQDQSAIVLDNGIAIYAPGDRANAAYKNVVRVVSRPKAADDLAVFWTAGGGEKLKDESANLLAESLDIALNQAAGDAGNANPHKTFRYLEGGSEKMERGQLVSERCGRVVLKTLRGWLMSVPSRQPAADCGETVGSAK